MSALPPPRVIRTAHTADGTSVVASDGPAQRFHPFGPTGTAFTIIDAPASLPVQAPIAAASPVAEAKAKDDANENKTVPRCPPAGLCVAVTDIPPRHSAPMHRTLSVDWAVVLAGEVVCVLDGGEERMVRAGEVLVQRGTRHAWENRGLETCRVLFFMAGSEKVVLADGTALEETAL